MNRELFWLLIENTKSKNTEEMLKNLIQKLSEYSSKESQQFCGYISAYMEHINDCIWVDMACKVINGYVSDDTSFYFALWLIAQGEKVLYDALVNPDSLSSLAYIPFGNAEFEMLMSIGMNEGENIAPDGSSTILEECGKEVKASIVYKDNSKYGGYDDFDEAMEDIPNVLPALIKRAQKEGFDWNGYYA